MLICRGKDMKQKIKTLPCARMGGALQASLWPALQQGRRLPARTGRRSDVFLLVVLSYYANTRFVRESIEYDFSDLSKRRLTVLLQRPPRHACGAAPVHAAAPMARRLWRSARI